MSMVRITLEQDDGTTLSLDDVVAWLRSKIYRGYACREVGHHTEKAHLYVILDDVKPDSVRVQWGRGFPGHRGNAWLSVKAIVDDGARRYAAKDGDIVWRRGYEEDVIKAFGAAWVRPSLSAPLRRAVKKDDFVSHCLALATEAGATDRTHIADIVRDAKLERGGTMVVNYLRGVTNAVWLKRNVHGPQARQARDEFTAAIVQFM